MRLLPAKVFVVLHQLLLLLLPNAFAIALIRPFSNVVDRNIELNHYHLAKVAPAGEYRVIIWDQQVGQHDLLVDQPTVSLCDGRKIFHPIALPPKSRRSGSSAGAVVEQQRQFLFLRDALRSENLSDDLAKCFVHYHSVRTDKTGRFLLRIKGRVTNHSLFNKVYNVNLIPLNNNLDPIVDNAVLPRETSGDDIAVQRIYVQSMLDPVDSICQKQQLQDDKQCLINYYATEEEREEHVNKLTKRWLKNQCYQDMSDMENFFLIANLRSLVTNATKSQLRYKNEHAAASVAPLAPAEAKLIGIFWNSFSRTAKSGDLWKRLRLVDAQVVDLINQFCEIDKHFLTSHDALSATLSKSNNNERFCSNWPIVREKATKCTNVDFVKEAFAQWLNTAEPLTNGATQMIHFWIDVFAKRLHSRSYNWPSLDRELFEQIGAMFVEVKSAQKLTADKILRIKGAKNSLDRICKEIFFIRGEGVAPQQQQQEHGQQQEQQQQGQQQQQQQQQEHGQQRQQEHGQQRQQEHGQQQQQEHGQQRQQEHGQQQQQGQGQQQEQQQQGQQQQQQQEQDQQQQVQQQQEHNLAPWKEQLCTGTNFQTTLTRTISNKRKMSSAGTDADDNNNNDDDCVNKEDDKRSCVICYDVPRNIAFSPCGHLCVCDKCAKKTQKCPMCRESIQKKLQIYNIC